MLKTITGKHHVTIPVDDSCLTFDIKLSGMMGKAVLKDRTGELVGDVGTVMGGLGTSYSFIKYAII